MCPELLRQWLKQPAQIQRAAALSNRKGQGGDGGSQGTGKKRKGAGKKKERVPAAQVLCLNEVQKSALGPMLTYRDLMLTGMRYVWQI